VAREEKEPEHAGKHHRPAHPAQSATVLIRDISFMAIGLAGLIHETFFVAGQRYVLLAIFATMLGLPGALQLDRTLNIRIGSQEKG
jgi:hypothetical protein